MKRIFSVLLTLALLTGAALSEETTIVDDVAVSEVPAAEVTAEPSEAEEADMAHARASLKAEPMGEGRLDGIIIGIDPGHQAHANSEKEQVAPGSKETKAKVASGTSGVSTGIAEYVTDLEIALQLRDALLDEGCTVYMTHDTADVDISNKERAELMNGYNCDLVLRLHCDGSTDRSANGIGMFVRKTGEKQEESEAAAEVLLEKMSEATGAKARGVFLRDTYTMNNWSTVPCILVEMGYMSNPDEDEKLNDPDYQKLLVQGMVEGICTYFDR